MAINTTLYQSSPYYDDYVSSGNEAKGHLKILFKPGVPVQTRELNQLQTLLQTQVDRFGSHIFANGSRVLDGDVTTDGDLFYIDIVFSHSDLVIDDSSVYAADVLTRIGLLKKIDSLIDADDGLVGLTADVIDYEALITTTSETKYRLYLRYTKRTANEGIFGDGQTIRSQTTISGTSISTGTVIGTVEDVGFATKLHVDKGVYFIGGYFVNVEETETIILRPDVNTRINGRVAFKITESIKTTSDDSSLFDNATGVPNTSAAGADRYAITLSLVALTDQASISGISDNSGKVFDLTGASSTEFVTLLSLQNGKKIQPLSTKYSSNQGTLGDTLSKRTYEESGNYTLNKFVIETREAYNDQVGNNGKYEATGSDITTLKGKYIVDVNPGVAYVEGKRTQIMNRFSIMTDKARDTKTGESVSMNSGVGTYIEGKFTDATLPDIQSDNSPVSSYIVGGTSPEATIIPTNIEKIRGTGLDTVFRLYFTLGTATYGEVNAATSIVDSTVSPQAEFTPIDPTFKVRGNKLSNKIVKLPRKLVNGVNTGSTEFVQRKEFSGTSGVAGDYTINITNLDPDGIIVLENVGSGESFTSTNPNDYLITDGITFGTVTDVTILSNTRAQITMSNITGLAGGGALTAIASVKTSLSLATKTLTTGKVANSPSPAGITTGEVIDLGVSDILEITSITGGDESPGDLDSPEKTITLSDFVLDNGQRDDSYQNGTLTYIGNTTIEGNISINFKYFAHGAGDYFSFESYESTLDYAKIPTYKGNRLSDVFDFRGSAAADLDPNCKINTVLDYYLPRYDSLIVTRQGEFLIKKGVSQLNPIPPEKTKGSMVLYNLYVPAYTFNAKAIRKEYFDHRRFTMRDIGALEKRISNLEYYTSLSLLEKQASDKEIFDSAGERFKNGIFVDSFTGHNRADVTDPKHVCAIDKTRGQLRPSFSINQVEVRIDGTSPDNYVRLPSVSTKTLVQQRFAAVHESVIPYNVTNYHGIIKLSPSDDVWVEVRRRPDVIENDDNNYDNITIGSDSSTTLETEWTTTTHDVAPPIDGQDAETAEAVWWMSSLLSGPYLAALEKRSDKEPDNEKLATEADNVRDYINSDKIHPAFRKQQPTKKEITIIPFIRSRRIYFQATGLKPNTRHYAYLDETNITGYATTLSSGSFSDFQFRDVVDSNRIDFYNQNAAEAFNTVSDARRDLTTNSAGTVEGYFIIPNNTVVRFPIGKKTFVLTDTNGGVDDKNVTSRAQSYYNASGTMEYTDPADGEVHLLPTPSTDSEVGPVPPKRIITNPEPEFKPVVSDPVPTYSLTVDDEDLTEGDPFLVTLTTTNVADGTNVPYTISGSGITVDDLSGASGTSLTGNFTVNNNTASIAFTTAEDAEVDEQELLTLRLTDHPDVYIQVRIDDTVTPPDQGSYFIGTWSPFAFCFEDPLAQSFRVTGFGVDDSPVRDDNIRGCFVKSLDIFFQAKNDTLPVTVQIVEVENGTPTSRIVKNGAKSLTPSSVNVSDNASTATTFTFDSAVYLDAEKEYAFIVRSNSKDYRVWMSETGNVDITTGERILKDPYLGVAFRSSNASTWTPVQTRDIKFNLNVHTFLAAGETTRTRGVGPNSSTQTNTGSFLSGIKNSFTLTSVQFSPGQIILPKTSIEYTLTLGSDVYKLNPNGTHLFLPSAVTISSASDIVLNANLTSEDEYLTPAIDLDRISLICYGNKINDDITNETDPASGNATARYISKKVSLNDPADKLNVYIGANQPEGSKIRLYARFDAETATPAINDARDASWVELTSASIPETTGDEEIDFTEISYEIDPVHDFTQFQLKIVMTSTDAAKVPIINDIRAITTI